MQNQLSGPRLAWRLLKQRRNSGAVEKVFRLCFIAREGVSAEYPATLTALLKNHGYSVRSVWGNNLKCSKAVLGAGYAVHGTR